MKKFIAFSSGLAFAGLLLSSIPALAGTISTPHIAGDFQGWDAAANPMTETSLGSDIWTATFGGFAAGERHEFKITDGTWDNNLPGPNSWFYADGSGNITITYDGNTYADGWSTTMDRIGLSYDTGSWTAAGDFQGWDNAANNMVAQGGGIYMCQVTTPGTWNWKAVVTGSWDSISWDNRSVGTANWEVTVNPGETANLYVDAYAGVARVEIVPEPTTFALAGLGLAALITLRRRS